FILYHSLQAALIEVSKQQSLLIQPFNINPPIPTTSAINTVKAKQTNVYLSDFSIYSFPFSSILISPKNRNNFI
ncbi:TPA: hypothetical protein ACSKKT_001253, partial [Listeria monocytogenes]